MSARDERDTPDVDRLAQSMLALHGAHDDDHDHGGDGVAGGGGSWSKAPNFASDPDRAAAVREATQRDRERYLNSGLVSIDCRFCHVSVSVKKLGPAHTSVQWNSDAAQRCAFFAELRESGGEPARARACPKLADSIKHAVAEGVLEEISTAPSPGDG
ncbi:hypothetical protein [Mycobacterium sp. 1274761.0]|uniref:hypothetical protein n=1 Tax=Mycobacterium sp. 1274761.0 TaxID=1834077 RepID=UPI0007FDEDD9|nr:hypothetical protein [Mycobacterium sp. 1274761.0]OBK74432.1 hypothetical protein A5651_09990 [Mycobacterium sp. 1274761.0]